MRHLLLGITLLSGLAMAAPETGDASQAKFEKRFQAADKDRNGTLSRQEAYAEFPRAPEFFDEIDQNKDGQVSMAEVRKARDKRVAAAMSGTSGNKNYALPAESSVVPAASTGETTAQSAFSSKAEARRQHRYDYYESLGSAQETARNRGEPMPEEPVSTILKKSF